MGKTTLYHPVSLHVIRGAAEYCGWKLGKITQVHAEQETATATYVCHIERMPQGLGAYPMGVILKQLKHCFVQDIEATKLWFTKEQKWFCQLEVDLRRPFTPELAPIGQDAIDSTEF